MSDSTVVERASSSLWASRLVVAFGVVFACNWAVAAAGEAAATVGDLVFALLLLAATMVTALGLRRSSRVAVISAVAIATIGLFFVAPIVGTMVLGGGTSPVGTGWDVVYFPLLAVILAGLLGFSVHAGRQMGIGRPIVTRGPR